MLNSAKSFGHRVLPTQVYGGVRAIWHWILAFGVGLHFYVTSGVPRTLICQGVTPGDNLLCTAVLRELRKRNRFFAPQCYGNCANVTEKSWG
jgi:hypothetical protein